MNTYAVCIHTEAQYMFDMYIDIHIDKDFLWTDAQYIYIYMYTYIHHKYK